MRICNHRAVPFEVRSAVYIAVQKAKEIFPAWIEELTIEWEPAPSGDDIARIEVDYHYAQATLTVYPRFISCTPGKRASVLTHEACHVLNAPLVNWARSVIEDATADNLQLQTHLLKEFDLRRETITESTSKAFDRLLGVETERDQEDQ